jgi:hypothetical protein
MERLTNDRTQAETRIEGIVRVLVHDLKLTPALSHFMGRKAEQVPAAKKHLSTIGLFKIQ